MVLNAECFVRIRHEEFTPGQVRLSVSGKKTAISNEVGVWESLTGLLQLSFQIIRDQGRPWYGVRSRIFDPNFAFVSSSRSPRQLCQKINWRRHMAPIRM
jgi:hypothetical protein